MKSSASDEFLLASQAARLLGKSPDAVRYYERTRRLIAERASGGTRLFRRSEVERFLTQLRAAQRVEHASD